jgi:hypothetical protein
LTNKGRYRCNRNAQSAMRGKTNSSRQFNIERWLMLREPGQMRDVVFNQEQVCTSDTMPPNARVRLDLISSCRDQRRVDTPFAVCSPCRITRKFRGSRNELWGDLNAVCHAPDVPLRLSLPIVRATSSKASDHVPRAARKPRSRFLRPDFRRDVVSETPQRTAHVNNDSIIMTREKTPQFAELPVVVLLVLHRATGPHCNLAHCYNSNVKFSGPLGYLLP